MLLRLGLFLLVVPGVVLMGVFMWRHQHNMYVQL